MEEEFHQPNGTLGLANVSDYFDGLLCSKFFGKNPPINPSSELYKNMWFLFNFTNIPFSQEEASLYSTPLLHQIVERFSSRIDQTTKLRMIAYSGHDTTITLLLVALNLTTQECVYKEHMNPPAGGLKCPLYPSFASSVTFELYKRPNNSYYIKFLYNDVPYSACKKEGTICEWEDFVDFIKERTVENFDQECGLPTRGDDVGDFKSWMIYMIIFLSVFSIVLLIIVFIQSRRYPTEPSEKPPHTSMAEEKNQYVGMIQIPEVPATGTDDSPNRANKSKVEPRDLNLSQHSQKNRAQNQSIYEVLVVID
eukprot:TRINITY_DN5396_c0_g1_i7.p1 TRINITY_DN5396_c0_g1~~TRINITY_DN5396_c0_g1_i7.p1  ORF type:complete len:309 (+),score=41.86 TRINITY_DN5396_c0_g1_i7:750-1676(+)